MPLTPAEKMKRYRDKLKQNPDKLEEIRKKNLERIKSKYKYKKISELTETEQKKQRKKWKEEKQKQKIKKSQKTACSGSSSTPMADILTDTMKISVGTSSSEITLSETSTETRSTILRLTKTVGSLRRARNKLKTEYDKAKSRIAYLERANETARKKIYRLQKHVTEQKTKFETELLKIKARNEILEASLKITYKNCENNKERDLIKKVANNNLVRNSKAQTSVSKQIGIRCRKKKSVKRIISDLKKSIIEFYIRDDVSRATAGKRECKTLKKNREQIRYLNGSLRALHEKYKKEGGIAAFSTFCRFKPFYILSPSIHNRNTCLCIKHSNMNLKIEALYRHKIIDFRNLHTLLEKVACNVDKFDCMYGICNICNNNILINYNLESSSDPNITWQMWETKNHSYKKNTEDGEQEVITKKTVKSLKNATVAQLIKLFEADIAGFKKHSFNASHQAKSYKICIDSLTEDEIAIHCDFSQNYECKMSEEVQSMHFGASKTQVTLHTGVIFFKGGQKSFCTVSPSNVHQPHAIWAHLKPIINLGKTLVSNIKRIHIFSDGPSSQYRQKNNFFLINYFSSFYNVDITWSFFESGHGKGVADAIGGVVKRCLDRQVSYGQDIVSAADVYSTLQSAVKAVNVMYITETEIDAIKECIPNNLKTIKGTMNIHQVICKRGNDHIQHRILSCFCSSTEMSCTCYDPIEHKFEKKINVSPQFDPDNSNETAILQNFVVDAHVEHEPQETNFQVEINNETIQIRLECNLTD
ncbi:uncharacterized protein LOC124645471 [Helicoverpa zea]|uniref:uncharacterized protein LOC124645471 n=1 Tax=Helicoverpa zea TaxID=7113 RepID=UPI001F59AD75|nr:uncharacterized protein LOC124645471 [Helicoverpa zea]